MRHISATRWLRGTLAAAAIVPLSALALVPMNEGGVAAAAASAKPFKVCMGTGGQGLNWQTGQGQVLQYIAHKEGWSSVVLSNNNSAATTVSNVQVFIQDSCNVVVEFNPSAPGDVPAMSAKFAAAKIPVITYDVGEPGAYFVGIDNLKAGIAGGQMLGKIIKAKWDCNLDLIIASHAHGAGIVDTQRTGGMITGILHECPNIPQSKIVNDEGGGQVSVALPAGRNVLAAHPTAKRIAVVGINDSTVTGTIEAAEQLGRAADIIGWGQDGSLITGPNVDPHLLGSVFYFLEGYPEATLPLLKEIAAGHAPPVEDNTHNNPEVLLQPCPVTAAQASHVPDYSARLQKLLQSPAGRTEYALFCPNK
jgi:ABC-type sugar transport system substrate-binding protein